MSRLQTLLPLSREWHGQKLPLRDLQTDAKQCPRHPNGAQGPLCLHTPCQGGRRPAQAGETASIQTEGRLLIGKDGRAEELELTPSHKNLKITMNC